MLTDHDSVPVVFTAPGTVEPVTPNKPAALPGIDVRNGHTVSTLIVALTGMMPGNYGDMRTGDGSGDYVHVTRNDDGSYRLRHVSQRKGYDGNNVTRAAQFVMNQV